RGRCCWRRRGEPMARHPPPAAPRRPIGGVHVEVVVGAPHKRVIVHIIEGRCWSRQREPVAWHLAPATPSRLKLLRGGGRGGSSTTHACLGRRRREGVTEEHEQHPECQRHGSALCFHH
ncbi:MAG TPA: hypothetical protein VFZ02_09670, partial [Ktedonobacteraceae bacterium]